MSARRLLVRLAYMGIALAYGVIVVYIVSLLPSVSCAGVPW